MVLYGIPDIRLFWSQDPRFTSQFATKESNITFKPFSKYPACYKDVSFWCKESIVHDNDICDLVREIAGDNVEKVDLIDEFNHPKKGTSKCYRIIYRSMDKTLSNAEVNDTQEIVRKTIAERLKVDLRE